MKTILTAILALFICQAYSQADLYVKTDEIRQVNDLENILRAVNYANLNNDLINETEGSAYLSDEFATGSVTLTSGVTYENVLLRYNVHNDQIEFQGKGDKVFNINNPNAIKAIKLGESKFTYINQQKGNENIQLFAEILTEGKITLLKQHRIKLMPAKPAETHRDAQPPKFVKQPSKYLLQCNNGNVTSFKNEKEFIAMLSERGNEVKKFIASQNLSIKHEDDLIKVIDYYNSL